MASTANQPIDELLSNNFLHVFSALSIQHCQVNLGSMSSTSAWRSIFSELDSHFVLKNWALLLSGSDDVIATKVHNAVPGFVDAEAKERSLPISWRDERVDEVVQRFDHRLSGKVDRHAALAMTEKRRVGKWIATLHSR